MNKKEYLALRKKMLDEAQAFIGTGKLDEAKNKREEIEKLDKEFEETAAEQANLNALNQSNQVVGFEVGAVQVENLSPVDVMNHTEKEISYDDVFSKVALQRDLTSEEIAVFNLMNPENVYTHTTLNTEIVIPETVVSGIEDVMIELHPILADVRTTRIKGVVKYVKRTNIPAGDAEYYDEATPTADEENTFGELTLNGKELSKAVTVSWKLQAMAVSDFIPFLQRELGQRMGYAKARAFVKGVGDAKYPQGVITAINAEDSTPQKVTYAASGLTYADITSAMSKIRSAYVNGAKIYANNGTVWNVLANLLDGQAHPLFIPDVTSGGVGRIFGLKVLEEDALGDGEILIANMSAGYKENVQESMKMVTEQHAKPRKTDFVGYEVHDGGVYDNKAFAYLVKGV